MSRLATHTRFVSLSGDLFEIPNETYDQDVEAYARAIENDDENEMMKFETGETGWRLVDG